MNSIDFFYNAINKYTYLSPQEFRQFSSLFELKKYKKKEYILRNGDKCNFEGFVTKGAFKVFFLDESGREQVAYFAIEGWWITDINSFLNDIPSNLNIVALEDSEVLMINKKDKMLLYEKLPKVETLFRIMNQRAIAALQKRVFSLLSKTAEERYREFRETNFNLELRFSQLEIASYLGISHEFLNKVRKKVILEG